MSAEEDNTISCDSKGLLQPKLWEVIAFAYIYYALILILLQM
jgi:hypothetical protein